MQRFFLPILTLLVLALILADRLGRPGRSVVVDTPTSTHQPNLAEAPPPIVTRLSSETGTPTIERLARLATRRTLNSEGRETYLDSLLLSTDSVLRRWPIPIGRPVRVAFIEPGATGGSRSGYVRDAFRQWENLGLDLHFDFTPDTVSADMVVKWISHFPIDRTGQTDLTWDQFGRVQRAVITLAMADGRGRSLPSTALMSVAIHEVGHALGLPHSALATDVMFPEPRITELSRRDRHTVTLLYQLPAGSVKDSIGP